MATVTIDSVNYTVYANATTADTYLAAEYTAAAEKWRDAVQTDADAKSRALVSATRLLDRQVWLGEKTDGEDQAPAWPRSETGLDYIDEDTVPQQIIDATILLAADINNGVDVIATDSTDTRTKSLKAGSVSIEYFRDLDSGPRFPTAVWELIAALLGGSSMVAATIAYGTDECSDFSTGYAPSAAV